MKGSPIISTLLAIIVMISIYFIMHTSLHYHESSPTSSGESSSNIGQSKAAETPMTTAYIEAHFSSPPTSFAIYHPVTNKKIIHLKDLSDNEWSDEIQIPKTNHVELNVVAKWDEGETNSENRQHFIQLVLSPNEKDDASITLRGVTGIDTTATFTWTP